MLSGITYYLNPKNIRFPFFSKEKLRLSRKVWNLKVLNTYKKKTSCREDFAWK